MYVGETGQALNRRVEGHRKSVRLKERYFGSHFNSNSHSLDYYSIQIIEKIYPMQGETDRQIMRCVFLRESFWIKELHTLHPYGLNDNLMGYGNISQRKEDGILHLFNRHKHRKRSYGHRKRAYPSAYHNIDIPFIVDKWNTNGTHYIKTLLYSLPHSKLNSLNDELYTAFSRKLIPSQLYYIAGDIIYC